MRDRDCEKNGLKHPNQMSFCVAQVDEHYHEGDSFRQHLTAFVLYGSAKFPEDLTESCSIDCITFLQKFDEENSFSVPENYRHDFLG